ncbi:MAG TPA: multidrug efflux SMR transporter [Candidatus Xenobia bacterium]|nr:multidrug efflux SMR transporter [Candidatus Xenobia bacterium]
MSAQAAWWYLFIAGLLEVGWAIAMKYSAGLTRPTPTVATFAMGFASFYFLAQAAERLPIGTAYAVWTGIGAVGTALLGMVLFGEPRHGIRLASILLIVMGIVGLRLFPTP